MPMKWVEPDKAGECGDVIIYHTYKEGNYESRLQYHYTTSYAEDEDFEFDVREIDVPEDENFREPARNTDNFGKYQEWDKARIAVHMNIIAHGLTTGQIKVDEDNNG